MWPKVFHTYVLKQKLGILSNRHTEKKIYFWADFQNQPILDSCDQFWGGSTGYPKMVNQFFSQISQNGLDLPISPLKPLKSHKFIKIIREN